MICYYDSNTKKFSLAQTPTKRSHFESVLKSREADLIVVEACGPSGWVNDLCDELEIIACSTNDGFCLATIFNLLLGSLPPCPSAARDDRLRIRLAAKR
jgi:hypothetical protein